MRKLMTALVLVGMLVGVVRADQKADALKAHALFDDGLGVDAQVAFENILTNYPDMGIDGCFVTQMYIGHSLMRQSKFAGAEIAYKKALDSYPNAIVHNRIIAYKNLGSVLDKQGKRMEANNAVLQAIILSAQNRKANEKLLDLFNRIKPAEMSDAAYKAMLTTIIKATPATEDYVSFLSRIKSELEKMK